MTRLTALFVGLAVAVVGASQRAVPSHEPQVRRPQPVREVARVNSVPIMSDRLDQAVNQLMPFGAFHRSVGADTMATLRQQALQQLVDAELRYQEGVRIGVTAPPAQVEAELSLLKKRYGGAKAFDQVLQQTHATMGEVRQGLGRELIIKRVTEREVAAKCQVSRQDASQFFGANPDRFVVPEQLHVYAITLGVDPGSTSKQWAEAKGRAEDLRRQILAGASFEDLARQYSTDKSKGTGGDMGFVHRGSFSSGFEEAVRTLRVGQTSEVVQTIYGYHIVRLAEVRPPERKTFAEVGDQIQKELTVKRCKEMDDALSARLRVTAKVVLTEQGTGREPNPHASGLAR